MNKNSKWIRMDVRILLVFLTFTLISCKSYYEVADFDIRTAGHKTVAILPFEMIFTGVKPEKLSDEELKQISESESQAFMISFYNEVLRSTHSGRKQLRIDVQHFDKTISILKANGLNVMSSWKEDPAALAKMLGVDAVVKARIEKHRLMSDLASYGLDLGLHILSALSDYGLWLWLPGDITKSKEIKSTFSLLDQQGTTLWSIAYDEDADWSRPANEIIDNINRKSAKHFPYRVK